MRKRVLSLFMACMMVLTLLPAPAQAVREEEETAALMDGEEYPTSGECGADGDNLTWTLDENGVLTIEGTGDMADYEYNNFPWYEGRTSIQEVIITDGVTSIGDSAFNDCTSLTSVTIPDGVTSIGSHAFVDCTNLVSVSIPDSVIEIGYMAFSFCASLTEITIPDSVTSIGDWAFSRCTSLTSIIIPDGVTEISWGAFDGCTGLNEITISDNVTSIRATAFEGCTGLTSVTIPSGVKTIESGTFNGCTNLAAVTIPASVTWIERETSPDPEDYGDYLVYDAPFKSCDNLTDVYYDGTIEEWEAVYIGEGNDPLLAATIHCSDGDIEGTPAEEEDNGEEEDNNEENPLTFEDSDEYDIPGGTVGDEIEEIDVSGGVSGGEEPYTFTAEGLPAGIEISEAGVISGTYEEAAEASTATVTVTDGAGETVGIEIDAGAVTAGTASVENTLSYVTLSTDSTDISAAGWLSVYAYPYNENDEKLYDGTISGEDDEEGSGFTWSVDPPDMGLTVSNTGGVTVRGDARSGEFTITAEPDQRTVFGEAQSAVFTVTGSNRFLYIVWQDEDGTELDRQCYTEGDREPETDAVPEKAPDDDYVYTFAEWEEYSEEGIIKTYRPVFDAVETEILVLEDSPEFDIPDSIIGDEIEIDVSGGLSGGEEPYTFTATGLPAGVEISEDGVISGTLETEAEESEAVITVTDSFGQRSSITIRVGAVLPPDLDAPSAVLSPKNTTVIVREEVVFDASESTDNRGIVYWGWDFGDGNEEETTGGRAVHRFWDEGRYTVTVTVRDAAENEQSARASVTVVSPDDAVVLTAKDTVTGEAVPGAALTLTGSDGTSSVLTDVNGAAVFSAGTGTFSVSAAADGYQDRSFSVEVTAEKRSFEVYLNASDVLQVETATKELTRAEAEEAGIDVDAPENRHVYESTAVFTFGELTYLHNDSDVLSYEPLIVNNVAAYPVSRDIYLIIYSRVNWLKELFRVQLLARNTSNFETMEDVSARLNLPDGLSLAVMTEGTQSLDAALGTIAPGGETGHNWYLTGDTEGEYTLSGTVTGTRSGADGSVQEPVASRFTTQNPISVLAGSAMNLTIGAEKYGFAGVPYTVRYTLENVSETTIYDLSLTVMGGKFVEDYGASDLVYDPEDLTLTGSLEGGFYLCADALDPGNTLEGEFRAIFASGLDKPEGMEYILKDMFSLTGAGSTTEIPTTFELMEHKQIVVTYAAGDGTGTMTPELLIVEEEDAESAYLTLPENEFTAPSGQTFWAWDIGGREYMPGDECELTEHTTATAVWVVKDGVANIRWLNDDGTLLELDEEVPYGEMPEYNGDEPEKEADAQYTYTFADWSPEVAPVKGDVTYTAVYENTVNTYTVTWVNSDGDVLSEEGEVPYGTTPVYEGNPPKKTADAQYFYAFAGWAPEVAPVRSDAAYTAVFDTTVRTYTVAWTNDNGEALETDADVPYGTEPSYDGGVPEREPDARYTYSFSGWAPEPAPVAGNVTYAARYDTTLNTYTVTWLNEDGTVLKSDGNVPYGTTPAYYGPNPERENDARYTYAFSGWTPEAAPITGETTYTAAYARERNTYTITWANEDGTPIKTEYGVPYGDVPIYEGVSPVKPGDTQNRYLFAGWTPAVTPAGEDITYRAVYQAKGVVYTVVWLNDDGTELDRRTYAAGDAEPVTDRSPVRAGNADYTYTFEGWTLDEDTGEVKTYVPVFNEIPLHITEPEGPSEPDVPSDGAYSDGAYSDGAYTVVWLNGDGTELDRASWDGEGTEPVTEKEPVPEDAEGVSYTFTGWALLSDTGTVKTYTPEFEIKEEPPEEILYTVVWLNADGTELDRKTYRADEAEPETDRIPVKEEDETYRYTFLEWDGGTVEGTTKTCTPVFTSEEKAPPEEPVTVYTVTFDSQGGSPVDPVRFVLGSPVAAPENPVKDGSLFKGWYTEPECKNAWDFNSTAAGDMTLYAGWEADPAQDTDDGGKGCYVATSVYGSYDCPQVWTLRRFRDSVLAETWYGRLFIRVYYAVSPTAVKLFGNMDWFRNFFRARLDQMVDRLQEDGFEDTPYDDPAWR